MGEASPRILLIYTFAAVTGLAIGSFLNVCIYRLPRRQSLFYPLSQCPSCNKPIMPWDNIPVLSYLLLHGKCRYCQRGISLRYPIVESLNAILYVVTLWACGLGVTFVVLSLLASVLIAAAYILFDTYAPSTAKISPFKVSRINTSASNKKAPSDSSSFFP